MTTQPRDDSCCLFPLSDREALVHHKGYIKFIYSEEVTKICKISTVDLTVTTQDKSTEKSCGLLKIYEH